MKTEIARGWGLKVDGGRPYLAYVFASNKRDIQPHVQFTYQRAVQAILMPLSEYRRLKALEEVKP